MYKINYIFIVFIATLLCGCAQEKNPDNYEIWGLDVSRHQDKINWLQVAEHEKPNFVFIKATEGTLIVDPLYKKHCQELEEAEIPWGAYHFFGHRTPGREQARNFIKTAKLKRGNMLPVLDIEYHRFMKDPRKSAEQAMEFCKEIKSFYGVYPIIYCSTNFYNSYLKDDFRQGKFILWIADYRGMPDLDWHFWQHTDSHKIKGIRGKVDRNVFRGDSSDFNKMIL